MQKHLKSLDKRFIISEINAELATKIQRDVKK